MRKLILLFTLLFCVSCFASNFTVLHRFNPKTGDALNPWGSLLLIDGTLYGISANDGHSEGGAVYIYNLASRKESVFFRFQGYGGSTGIVPTGLIWDAVVQLFYGVTESGPGDSGCGTIFSLDMAGTETTLYAFTGTNGDGCQVLGGLMEDSQGNLYGTTFRGGDANCDCGTVWEFSDGSETVFHAFTGGNDGSYPYHTTPLLDSSGNLWGVTNSGGGSSCPGTWGAGCGTIYEVSAGVYSVAYSFSAIEGPEGIAFDASGVLWEAGKLVCPLNYPPDEERKLKKRFPPRMLKGMSSGLCWLPPKEHAESMASRRRSHPNNSEVYFNRE